MFSQIFYKLKMVVIFATIFFVCNTAYSFESIINQHGIWIVRHNLKSKASIDRVIDNLEKLQIKNAYIQIRGRGYSYYNSSIEPKTPGIEEGLDPLQYFISKASQKDIKIHAWINTYLLWTNPNDPNNKNHLFFKHPEWFEVSRTKSNNKSVRNIYLSPHLQSVNLYLLALIEELVDKYYIDGIHLDYVRYYDENSGYNENGIIDFLQNTDIDVNNFNNSQEWIDYKASKIDELVSDISELLKIQNKDIIFSAAVKPNPKKAFYSFGQNWVKWLENNWVDHVVLMNYANNLEVFTENLSLAQIDCEIDNIFCGIGLWNKPKEIIIDQIIESKKLGFHQLILFSYDTLIEKNWIK